MSGDLHALREYIRMAILPMPDPRTGHGYGHLGKSRAHGSEYMNSASYPYEADDPYAYDLDDEDDEFDDIISRFRTMTRSGALGRQSPSPPGDTMAFATSATRLDLAHVDAIEIDESSYQQVFTSAEKSQRPTWGTTKGWSQAPFNAADEDDPDAPIDMEDVIDRALDPKPRQLSRQRRSTGKFEW